MSATTKSTGAMRLAQNLAKQPATSQKSFFALPSQQICQQRRPQSTGRRRLHSTSQKDVALPLSSVPEAAMAAPAMSAMAPLSCLKLSEVLRSYLITTMSSSPTLLSASTNLLRQMLESKNPLLNLENPLMRAVLFETFYKQFCAGWDAETIGARCKELRAQGYSGVILEYALEVLKDAETDESKDIATWREGMLRTCDMAAEGDFLGLKWSGMGPAALQRMAKEQPPSKEMSEAMHTLAKAASKKNIALLPSAEETWNLTGYHSWTLDMQREYNTNGKSVLYNTYQMYLKEAPKTIAEHLEISKAEGFTYGAKFVRGAYLASEPRHVIHDTIENTHAAYDGATEAFIHRQYNDTIKPINSGTTTFDNTRVVVASHNAATVEKAQELRRQQKKRGEELTPLVFAQLQGMADEVSCSLLAAAKNSEHNPNAVRERVFKCTTSGTMYQCLNYLLRRAAENKDAAGRTWETREAMQAELWRRMKATFGLA